jgi:hypothetical protein
MTKHALFAHSMTEESALTLRVQVFLAAVPGVIDPARLLDRGPARSALVRSYRDQRR